MRKNLSNTKSWRWGQLMGFTVWGVWADIRPPPQILDVLSKVVFSFMIVNMNVYETSAAPTQKEYV